jgi:hypothetical protein
MIWIAGSVSAVCRSDPRKLDALLVYVNYNSAMCRYYVHKLRDLATTMRNHCSRCTKTLPNSMPETKNTSKHACWQLVGPGLQK